MTIEPITVSVAVEDAIAEKQRGIPQARDVWQLLAELNALRAVASPSARVRHSAAQMRAAEAAMCARWRGAR